MERKKITELLDWLVARLNEREDVEFASRVDGEDSVGLEIDGVTYFVEVAEA